MLEKSSKACDTNKEKVTDKSHNERILGTSTLWLRQYCYLYVVRVHV